MCILKRTHKKNKEDEENVSDEKYGPQYSIGTLQCLEVKVSKNDAKERETARGKCMMPLYVRAYVSISTTYTLLPNVS